LDYGNTVDGTKVQLWSCNHAFANSNQQWYPDVGHIWNGLIGIAIKTAALTVSDHRNGGAVFMSKLGTSENPQQTFVVMDVRGTRFKMLKLIGTNLCLDSHFPRHNGAHIQVWTCGDNTSNQHWLLENNQIKPATEPHFCLDLADGDDQTHGKAIRVWTCAPAYQSENQQWYPETTPFTRSNVLTFGAGSS
jgi:hypothetical protein